MTTPDRSPPARGRLPIVLAVALTIALLGGYSLARTYQPRDGDLNVTALRQPGIACVHDVGMDERYCKRFITDLTRRAPLTPDQIAPAQSAKRAVTLALSGDVLNRCNTKREDCDDLMAWAERPATPEWIRSRLVTLATNLEVRLARPDDPAVAGSVVFGVLIGSVCVYGHQRLNKEPDRVYAAGPLPGGTCLT